MSHHVSIYAKCPYYRYDEKKTIYCENLIADTNVHLRFNDAQAFVRHRKTFCLGDYNRCPLAQTLNRKYGYQDR